MSRRLATLAIDGGDLPVQGINCEFRSTVGTPLDVEVFARPVRNTASALIPQFASGGASYLDRFGLVDPPQ